MCYDASIVAVICGIKSKRVCVSVLLCSIVCVLLRAKVPEINTMK